MDEPYYDLEPDYDGPIDIYGESLTGVSSETVEEIARKVDEWARQKNGN